MGSAGKWVLGLLLLVVGAVFVARAVSSDPESQATVKNNLQADPASVAKANAATDAAKQKKIASTTAGDVACKKACIEVNEVANDSVTTAKLAPGSVTLSKLAFEVPNLNELENEINARKAAEASAKVAASDLASATAKNDAAITAAASNGITAEAALRTAADQDLATRTAAADADLLTKLNNEIVNRGLADDVLQAKLNTEIADRAAALSGLRAELINPNQVLSPIVQINNNEIVGSAVSTDKILADTILAADLATGSVTTDEILDATVGAVDLGNDSVIGGAGGDVKDATISAEDLALDSVVGGLNGDIKDNTVDENDLKSDAVIGGVAGDVKDGTLDNFDLALDAVIGGAGGDVKDNTIDENDLKSDAVIGGSGGDVKDGTIDDSDLSLDAVIGGLNGDVKDNTIDENDLKADAVIGGLNGDVKDGTIDANDLATGAVAGGLLGDVVDGSITGQADNNLAGLIAGDLAFNTVGRKNLVAKAVDTAQLEDSAVTSTQIALNTITDLDVSILDASNLTGSNIRTGTITGQATNTAGAVSGDLALDTVGRQNLVDEAVDADKLDAALLSSLQTEAEFAAFLVTLKADEATGPKEPNDDDGFLHWNHLEGVPADILGASGNVNAFKNQLKNTGSGASTANNLVSWTNLGDLPSDDLIDGVVDFGELTGVPTSLTATFSDNALTFSDLGSSTIGATQIATGTVTFTMLESAVQGRITALETAVDALEQNFLDLANAAMTTPAVSSKHLTGYTVLTTTAAASVPAAIPAGGVGEMVLTVANITDNDLFTVNTSPTTPLPNGVFITSSDVDALTGIIHVRLFNSTGIPQTPVNIDWKIRWMDLGA